MASSDSAVELDEKLLLLKQNFFQELQKIEEQRLKHDSTSTARNGVLGKERLSKKAKEVDKKEPAPMLAVPVESSVGEKLALSRATSEDLENKRQKVRLAFEDKQRTVERVKAELQRREKILVKSVMQIEAFVKAMFYLKQEAEEMYVQQQDSMTEHKDVLKQMQQDVNSWKAKKISASQAINVLNPSKLLLEDIISDWPEYSSICHLLEYYLALKTFQKELQAEEQKIAEEKEELVLKKQKADELTKQIPALVVSNESTIFVLSSKLKNLRGEISILEEQIYLATYTKVKEDAAWFDTQKWIKKIFDASVEVLPGKADELAVDGTLNMLDGLKNFAKVSFEVLKELKQRRN